MSISWIVKEETPAYTTKMLAAVQAALGYENLSGYLYPTGKPPNVQASAPNIRSAMGIPTSEVPGAKTPLPNSSAKPNKQTNARIVYTRVQTQLGLEPGHPAHAPCANRARGATTR